MKQKPIQIDRDKLRAAVRRLGNEQVFYMLDDAIERLAPAKLLIIAKNYLDLKTLQPDGKQMTPRLLKDVRRFEKASMAGEYYEPFSVNSKNYTQKSAGTCAWIAEYRRHLDRCVLEAKGSDPAEVREAMDRLNAPQTEAFGFPGTSRKTRFRALRIWSSGRVPKTTRSISPRKSQKRASRALL